MFGRTLPVACFMAAAVLAAPAKHVTYIRPVLQTLPVEGVTQIVLQNLVGPISVQAGDGNEIKLEVLIHAGGIDDMFAHTLAQQLDIKTSQSGGQLRIETVYPLDHFRDFGYPNMKSILGFHGTDGNEYDGQKVFIRDVGSSKAVELWAEIRLTMPARVGLVIRNTYGDVNIQSTGAPSAAALDAFTDVGDFTLDSPRWATVTVRSDYGKVDMPNGLGVANDLHLNTQFGGAYLALGPGIAGQIVAQKDLGFLHNDFTDAKFSKNADGYSVMTLGDGHGPTVHVDMSVGSLHLRKIGDPQ